MQISDNIRGAGLMAASMAAFVANDTLVKLASADVALFQAVFLRGIVATALIVAMAVWKGHLWVKVAPGDRKTLALRLFGEIGATICFLTALFNMPLANATAILQALPLAVTLGAAVFLREPVGWRRWTAIVIGFAGVLIIVRPGSEGFNVFSLSAIGAVCFVVVRDLATRKLTSDVPSIFVAMLTSIAITVMGALMIPVTEWNPIDSQVMLYLAGAACLLIFGYLFSVMTMRVGEIAFIAPFRYTVLIWAVILGVIVFGEFPDTWTLVGSAIVIATGIYTFHRERVKGRSIPHRNRRP